MNIRTKITMWMAAIAVIPLLIAMALITFSSTNLSSETLRETSTKQLISIRDARKSQIEDYFEVLRHEVQILSKGEMVSAAMAEFIAAFFDIESNTSTETSKRVLKDYYDQQFAKEFRKQNHGKSIATDALFNKLSPEGLYWQWRYIGENQHPLGAKHKLLLADGEDEYNLVHKHYHPYFADVLQKFEFYDIFLIDAASGNIVYSVYKELDFATSLKSGPYANSGLAKAYQQAVSMTNKDAIALVDFEGYTPSYDAPASFMASPIFDKSNKVIGVLAIQMPIGHINEIMTSEGKWRENGFGDSGETYLVGGDFKAKSISRFLVEDPTKYKNALLKMGTAASIVDDIIDHDTNIGFQEIRTLGTEKALAGETGVEIFANYLGVDVLSAFTPIDIDGLNWVLINEIDQAEAFAGATKLANTIYLEAGVILVIMSVLSILVGLFVSRSISKPMSALSDLLVKIDEENSLLYRSDNKSKDELGRMSLALNSMFDNFAALLRDANQSSERVADSSQNMQQRLNQNVEAVDQQKVETEQVVTAMNQMTVTIKEVAKHTEEAASLVMDSMNQTKEGKVVVELSSKAIRELSQGLEACTTSAQRLATEGDNIGSVTDVIKDISEQTNLLALNAAIEAARAGEQGRGFAVVADEVRKLAQRTQESIEKIEQTVDNLRKGSNQMVDIIEKSRAGAQASVDHSLSATQAFESISESITHIGDYSNQISTALQQQSITAEQMNVNVHNINDISIQTAERSQKNLISSEELMQLAIELKQQINKFKI